MINRTSLSCSISQTPLLRRASGLILSITALALAILGSCCAAGSLQWHSAFMPLFVVSSVLLLAGLALMILNKKKDASHHAATRLPSPDGPADLAMPASPASKDETQAIKKKLSPLAKREIFLTSSLIEEPAPISFAKPQKTSFRLPSELTYFVFSYLSASELAKCTNVCQEWYQLARIHPTLKWGRIYHHLEENQLSLISFISNNQALVEDALLESISIWNLAENRCEHSIKLEERLPCQYVYSQKIQRLAISFWNSSEGEQEKRVVLYDENLTQIHSLRFIGPVILLANDSSSGDILVLETNALFSNQDRWKDSTFTYSMTNITKTDFDPCEFKIIENTNYDTFKRLRIMRAYVKHIDYDTHKQLRIMRACVKHIKINHRKQKSQTHSLRQEKQITFRDSDSDNDIDLEQINDVLTGKVVIYFTVSNGKRYYATQDGYLIVEKDGFALKSLLINHDPTDFICLIHVVENMLFTFSYKGIVKKWSILEDDLHFLYSGTQPAGQTTVLRETNHQLLLRIISTKDGKPQLQSWVVNID